MSCRGCCHARHWPASMAGPEEWACKMDYDEDEDNFDAEGQCRHKYTLDDYEADHSDYLHDMRSEG